MNNIEYDNEIKSLAVELVRDVTNYINSDEDVFEYIRDNGLDHELVDGHAWIIYYSNNLDVIANSPNDTACNEYGDDGLINALKQGGVNQLHTYIAYCAMKADLDSALYSLEENREVA